MGNITQANDAGKKKLYDVSMLINTAFKLAVAKCFTFLGILVFVMR